MNHTISRLFLTFCILLATRQEILAESSFQKVVSSRSRVHFKSNSTTLPIAGSFNRYTGQVEVDPETHQLLQAAFNIDLSTPQIDNTAPQFIWLARGLLQGLEAPIAKFHSSKISRVSDNRVEAHGSVQLGNRSEDLVIPITILTINEQVSRLRGNLEGSVAPKQFTTLYGELNFDLWFEAKR